MTKDMGFEVLAMTKENCRCRSKLRDPFGKNA